MTTLREEAVYTRFSFRAMNTDIEVALWAGERQAAELQRETIAWFQAVEAKFSRFLPDSELSNLNRSAGKWFLSSAAMIEVLLLAESYRSDTGGIFEPLLLRALEAAGYDESFDAVKRRPGGQGDRKAAPPERTRERPAFHAGMKAVRLPSGASVDLGGIVKSWAARRLRDMMRAARRVPCGMIDAGGDLTVWGGKPIAGEPWHIAIEHPWRPEADAGCIEMDVGAAATSSKLGRQWRAADGAAMHHLLDPRTQRPSESDVAQCTVAGPDVVACEVWAKTICIAGSEDGIRLLEANAPAYAALVFTDTRRALACGYAPERFQLASEWREKR
ncbi:MAG: FAD:protein FMN transferase [Paenibacillaceae bacterium]|nr:FAD:protein FMN transferase [Paenibacillaceae bacterium]